MPDAWEGAAREDLDMGDVAAVAEEVAGQTSHMNEAAAALAREKGWAEPQKYNYDVYNASNKPREAGTEDGAAAPVWACNAAKYEWKEEYGDVGPRNEELEKMLFRSDYHNRAGDKFEHLREIKVTAETTHQPQPVKSFDDAGLHPIMLENVKLCGYAVPTPVQAYSIPAIMNNYDLMAVAQTGSGKTAAFLIPVLSKLMGKAKKLAAPRPNITEGFDSSLQGVRAEPLVLIVAPTRELVTQIFDEARRFCYRSMLRPCVVYGGGPIRDQRMELQKGCDVLIATPGRLIDFMDKPHVLSLSRVRYTIIDEADEMLHSDWDQEFVKIMSGGDTNEDADHRYMMFSATFNKDCRELARKYLSNDYVRIRIGRAGSTHLNVSQQVFYTEDNMKKQCLYDLLLAMPPSRTLVFVNSKSQADLLDDYLFNMGLPSTSIHSDRTQLEREDALRAFRTAKSPILVTTGVAARGLDVKNVMHVINFDLPSCTHGGIDEYIHRIGRTARIGNEGLATSFYNDRNDDISADLVKILIESKQPVPDFLQSEVPEGELTFDDDTDNEGDGNGEEASGDAYGDAYADPATEYSNDTAAAAVETPAPAEKVNTGAAW